MKRVIPFLCGWMLLYPALGERITHTAESETLTVAVFPGPQYAPQAIREMMREVASILKASGLKLKWRLEFGQTDSGHQVYDEPLAVVKLSGHCSMDLPRMAAKSGPLGWTHAVDGQMLPFSELACDSIRRAIQSEIHLGDLPTGNALLGRALGRVLAHELYHIMAGTRNHTAGGISQAALSGAELVSERLELDPAGVELIQEHLHGGR